MCGRYSLTTAPEALRRLFAFLNLPNLEPRYNIAPTQAAPVVRAAGEAGARELVMMRWGLVPAWAKEISPSAPLINARADTVATKPSFRDAFSKRRCLVPADGFYEWREEDGRRQPFRIGMKGGAPFAFAGIWELWEGARAEPTAKPTEPVLSYAIVTTDANERLSPIHDRMPVILAREDYSTWLDPANDPARLRALLRAFAAEPMAFYRVSTRVNSVRNDDPACIELLNRSAAAT